MKEKKSVNDKITTEEKNRDLELEKFLDEVFPKRHLSSGNEVGKYCYMMEFYPPKSEKIKKYVNEVVSDFQEMMIPVYQKSKARKQEYSNLQIYKD